MDRLGRQGAGVLTQETTMFFRQHPAANATLSYFFGCAGLQKAVAVDVVAGDEVWFIEEAEKTGVQIAYVIDTAGNFLASGGSSMTLIGRNVTDLTDSEGRHFMRTILEGAKAKSSGVAPLGN